MSTPNIFPSANALPPSLRRGLASVRRRFLWLLVLAGLGKTLAAFCAALLLEFVADRFFFLPAEARLIFVLVIWGVAAAGLFWWVLTPARRRDDDVRAAFEVEKHFPELEERLSSTVELSRSGMPDEFKGSPQLITALRDQTLRQTAALKFDQVISPHQAWRAWMCATSSAALLTLFLLFNGAEPSLFWKRFFAPLSPLPKPSTVQFDVAPGDASVEVGGTVEIRAAVSRGQARRAVLIVRDEGGRHSLEMAAEEDGKFRAAVTNITSSIEYLVRAGDAQSPNFRITPLYGPQIAAFEFQLEFPAYTRLPIKTLRTSSGDLSALAGTRARLVVEVDRALSEAQMQLTTGKLLPMRLETPRRAAIEFVVKHDAEYRMKLVDAHGIQNSPQLVYRLKAQADQPPEIQILEPASDEIMSRPRPMTLVYEAKDDFGVSRIFLVAQRPKEPLQRSLLRSPNSDRASGRHIWNLTDVAREPEEEIVYWLEAEDTLPDRPNIGRSKEFRLYLSQAADLALRSKEWRGWKQMHEMLTRLAATLAEDIRAKQNDTRAATQRQRTDADLEAAHTLAFAQFQRAEHSRDARDFENVAARLRDLALLRVGQEAEGLRQAADEGRQLRDDFAKLYDARQTTSLLQNVRRVALKQQQLSAQTRMEMSRLFEKGTIAELTTRQQRVAADLDSLAQGFATLEATHPENANRLSAANRLLRSLKPTALNCVRLLQEGQLETATASQKLLLDTLSQLSEQLEPSELVAFTQAQEARARLETANTGFAALLLRFTGQRELLIRFAQRETNAHRSAARGDKQWAAELQSAAKTPPARLAAVLPSVAQAERQKETRELARATADAAQAQETLLNRLLTTAAWQNWRMAELAEEQAEQRGEWLDVLLRMDALSVRLRGSDVFAARDMDAVRQAVAALKLPEKFDEARRALERKDQQEAQQRCQSLASDLRRVQTMLEALLKRNFALAQNQKNEATAAILQIRTLAERQENLSRETDAARNDLLKAAVKSLNDQQEQLRRDARILAQEMDRQIRDSTPQSVRETEFLRDMMNARARLTQIEREQMRRAQEQLQAAQVSARESQTPLQEAAAQQKNAADQLRELARALQQTAEEAELRRQTDQLGRLALQQEQTRRNTQTLAEQNSQETVQVAAQQRQLAEQARQLGEQLQQTAASMSSQENQALRVANEQLQRSEEAAVRALQQQRLAEALPQQTQALQAIQQARQSLQNAEAAARQHAEQARAQLRRIEQESSEAASEAQQVASLQRLQRQMEQQQQIRQATEALDPNQRAEMARQAEALAQREQALALEISRDLPRDAQAAADLLDAARRRLEEAAEAARALVEQEKLLGQSLEEMLNQQQIEKREAEEAQENINRAINKLNEQVQGLGAFAQKALGNDARNLAPIQESARRALESLRGGDLPAARQAQQDTSNSLAELARRTKLARDLANQQQLRGEGDSLKDVANSARSLAEQQASLARQFGAASLERQNRLAESARQQQQVAKDLRVLGQQLANLAREIQPAAPQAGSETARAAEQSRDQLPPAVLRSAEALAEPTLREARALQPAVEQKAEELTATLHRALQELEVAQQAYYQRSAGEALHEAMPREAARLLANASREMQQAARNLQQQDAARAVAQMPKIERQLGGAYQALLRAAQEQAETRSLQSRQQQLSQNQSEEVSASKEGRAGREQPHASGEGALQTPSGNGKADEDWARLQSELKDELSQSLREGYPPEYEILIKQYYRRLAEVDDKSGKGQ